MVTISRVRILCGSVFLCLLCLSGCSLAPQTKQLGMIEPLFHEIPNVPFFPQEQYYCGPTALAEVFNFYGRSYDPVELARQIYIPKRQGSLQIEMQALVREKRFLAYAGKASLPQLLSWVGQDKPVIVLQNLGVESLPYWHYSVVKGYDSMNKTVTLHTGVSENRKVDMQVFENTWRRSDYWVLVPLPEGTVSKDMNTMSFIQASMDLLSTKKETLGISFLKLAHDTWVDNWLAAFMLGNHFLKIDSNESHYWYQQAIQRNQAEVSIWNNDFYALQKMGCQRAVKNVSRCLMKFNGDSDKELEVRHSVNEVLNLPEKSSGLEGQACHVVACPF